MVVPFIAAGVQTDCETLLERFTQQNTVRFEAFIQIWQDMKFSQIYCGRDSFRELWEFTEEVFKIVKQYFLPPHSFQVRVGALYLLYGLYYKQPNKDLVKIRLTHQNWEVIKQFLEKVREDEHHDVNYIFHKLYVDEAFYFTAYDIEYGPDWQVRKDIQENEKRSAELTDQSTLTDLQKEGILEQLSALHGKYHDLKCAMAESSCPDKSLDVIHPDLVPEMSKKILNIQKRFQLHLKATNLSGDAEEEEEEEEEVTIGTQRKHLKSKAFGNIVQASLSQKSCHNKRRLLEKKKKTSPTKLKRKRRSKGSQDLETSEKDETTEDSSDRQAVSAPLLVETAADAAKSSKRTLKKKKKRLGRPKKGDEQQKKTKKEKKLTREDIKVTSTKVRRPKKKSSISGKGGKGDINLEAERKLNADKEETKSEENVSKKSSEKSSFKRTGLDIQGIEKKSPPN